MTLATGLAMGGMRPVVALYSTFLQRAFDQTVHDVCQNDQPVLIAVDRAGLVGEDGTSHQGMFTLSAQRQLPNLVIASPKDEQELRSLLHSALAQDHPFALHYPRDPGLRPRPGHAVGHPGWVAARCCAKGATCCSSGSDRSWPVRSRRPTSLEGEGWSIGVINARFARPLDRQLILDQARGKRLVVTFEESVVTGGFGSGVLELVEEARLADPAYRDVAGADRRDPRRPVRRPRFGGGPAARTPAGRTRVSPSRFGRPSPTMRAIPAAPRSRPLG